MENYYELLQVDRKASFEVISKVFKYHIKQNHPDLFTGKEKEIAEIKVKKLNEAYDILLNPEKRKLYDEKLKEYEKNNIQISKEFEQLINENQLLQNKINNYNKFIQNYFPLNSNEILQIINGYDNGFNFPINNYTINKEEYINNNTIQNESSYFIKYLKSLLKKVIFYTTIIFSFFLILSIILRVNIFKIFIDTFF